MTPVLTISRNECYYPGCKKPAEQWHHVWPRCVTGQKPSDRRGTIPTCREHHALATADSTLIKAGHVCWEATPYGQKNVRKLIKTYKNGASLEAAGEPFGIVGATVCDILDRLGIPRRTSSEALRLFKPQQDKAIRRYYELRHSIPECIATFGGSRASITKAIKRAGGAIRTMSEAVGLARRRFTTQQDKAIRRYYEARHSMPECMDKFDGCRGAIRDAIKRAGGVMRAAGTGKQGRKFTPAQDKAIRRYSEAGNTPQQCADKFGCDSSTIRRIIKRAGGTVRTLSEANRKFTPEQDKAIRLHYEAGNSAQQCRDTFGGSRTAIEHAIKRAGGVMRNLSEAQTLKRAA